MSTLPLVIDLDGTLIRSDTLHEQTLRLLRDSPLATLRLPFWLSAGKASLKKRIAQRVGIDPKSLPYNAELLEWLKAEKTAGRRLVLCTAADKSIADPIARHLDIFDEVIASDGTTNLAGRHKADALVERYGSTGFDYAGNSSADLHVWERARRAVVVNASAGVTSTARSICEVERVFPTPRTSMRTWVRALRAHQWAKNVLLFVPLLAAHDVENVQSWLSMFLAFVAFSLCASSVYIGNDLFDLDSDRLHPRKRHRPFASGQIPAWVGVVLAPILLGCSLAIATLVSPRFLEWVGIYFGLTCAYSWGLKRVVLVDCIALAMLYTVRIIAGAAAADHVLSFWLLAFSVFLFLSLAFLKRYAELHGTDLGESEKLHGRGYFNADAGLILSMGVTSGYASVLVLALYLNSDAVLRLYRAPEIMWGSIPVLLFWVSWMWMQAHRGEMHDDPVVFALKDRGSLLAGASFALVLSLGAVGVSW